MPRTKGRREIYMKSYLLKLLNMKIAMLRVEGKKITVAMLAKELGISEVSMSHKKNGLTELTLPEAIKLFDILEFTDQEILSVTKK